VPAVTVGAETILMEDVPVFLKVIPCTALFVPTTTLPKFTAVGDTVLCAPDNADENMQIIAVSDSRTFLFRLLGRFLPRSDIAHSPLPSIPCR
jgi:hypothetical protein